MNTVRILIYFSSVVLLITLHCVDVAALHPKALVTTMELCKRSGYPIEEHEDVETSDGYLLTLHRIPHGRRNAGKKKKPVVFIMHGIFCNSAVFVTIGKESLAFLLADAGYDVWLGNARGNEYSRKHVDLDPDSDHSFWKFSWHQIGTIDLPTMIDYILDVTKQKKLYYVGHSQGTTSYFVMSSEMPDYNEKVHLMIALAPVAYMGHIDSMLLQLMAPFASVIAYAASFIGMYEFLPSRLLFHRIGKQMCDDNSPFQEVCSSVLFLAFGWDSEQLNRTLIPLILSTLPAGASWMQLVHYGQLINSAKFCQYDYGYWGNYKKYGSLHPPEYNTDNMTTPIAFYYSENDKLASTRDVKKLAEELPNLVTEHLIPFGKFNHMDFLYAIDVKELVYDPLLKLLKRHPI